MKKTTFKQFWGLRPEEPERWGMNQVASKKCGMCIGRYSFKLSANGI